MRHKYPYLIILVVLLASIYLVLFNTPTQESEPDQNQLPTQQQFKPFTASFFIITNTTERNFSAPMYHNLSEEVYITQENPQTIYVQKSRITWKDFFSTLPMGLSSSCLITGTGQTFCDGDPISSVSAQTNRLSFILNGKNVPQVLEQEIQPNDVLLISYGSLSNKELEEQHADIVQKTASTSANIPVE